MVLNIMHTEFQKMFVRGDTSLHDEARVIFLEEGQTEEGVTFGELTCVVRKVIGLNGTCSGKYDHLKMLKVNTEINAENSIAFWMLMYNKFKLFQTEYSSLTDSGGHVV